jgi:hypothetical protein
MGMSSMVNRVEYETYGGYVTGKYIPDQGLNEWQRIL